MNLDKENVKKITKIVIIAIFFYWVLQNISVAINFVNEIFKILSPFIAGACLAFIINMPMKFFENKLSKKDKKGRVIKGKLTRPIALILSILLVIVLVSLIIGVVIPELFNVLRIFIGYLPEAANNIKSFAIEITEKYPDINKEIMNIDIDMEEFSKNAINVITSLGGNIISSSVHIVSGVIGAVVDLVISIIFAIYILFSKEKLLNQAKKIVLAFLDENKASYIFKICTLSNTTFNNFIKGQCTEALVLGTLCAIGMLILQIPYAVTIGILMAFTALIPIVGAFIGVIIGAILILAVEPIKAVIFIIFVLILQQLENNLIYPKIVGKSVGLPGIWVLLSVTVGGSLAGVVGMIIGLPVVSVIYTIIKDETNERLEKKNIKV